MAHQTPSASKDGPSAIARLNDWLRDHIYSPGNNRVVITHTLSAMIGDVSQFRNWRRRAELLRTVQTFDAFDAANDPHGEHDAAMFDFEGHRCFWKIDCYNLDLTAGSEDPSDPAQTVRVLTIMHCDDM